MLSCFHKILCSFYPTVSILTNFSTIFNYCTPPHHRYFDKPSGCLIEGIWQTTRPETLTEPVYDLCFKQARRNISICSICVLLCSYSYNFDQLPTVLFVLQKQTQYLGQCIVALICDSIVSMRVWSLQLHRFGRLKFHHPAFKESVRCTEHRATQGQYLSRRTHSPVPTINCFQVFVHCMAQYVKAQSKVLLFFPVFFFFEQMAFSALLSLLAYFYLFVCFFFYFS